MQVGKGLIWVETISYASFGRFTKVVESLGFKQSHGNHTLFLKHSHEGKLVLPVNVDNIIISDGDAI